MSRFEPHAFDSVTAPLLSRFLECNICGRSKSPKRYRARDLDLEGLDDEEPIQIGEGGFAKVFRCRDRNSGQIVAIKQTEIPCADDGVPGSLIREVAFLKELRHENVVSLLDVKIGEMKVNLVFEHLDFDLHQYISELHGSMDFKSIKRFMHQILSAIAYCHSHKILHRDLKPRNVLMDHSKMIIKLADFGLAREFAYPDMLYTEQELAGIRHLRSCYTREYSTPVDLWSVGCIFGEMVIGRPIFQTTGCRDELDAIFKMLGSPTNETLRALGVTVSCNTKDDANAESLQMDLATIVPDLEPEGRNLLKSLLCLNPNKRISAEAALEHAYFNDLEQEYKKWSLSAFLKSLASC